MIFFTSDTHFGHKNIIKQDDEHFLSIDERDEHILANHNAVVGKDDDVWHLGDVSFSKDKLFWYLANANGRIHLIRGNHDDDLAWKYRERFASCHESFYLHRSKTKTDYSFHLSHYAMLRWRNSHYNSTIHVFGHSHGKLDHPSPMAIDVGVKPMNYFPVSAFEIVKTITDRQ